MKKTFQFIGIISLVCFSFFVTDKTANVVNNMDSIMIDIKENSDKYKTDSIDATVKENTIIPGMYGKEVNINKSYKKMKNSGYYSENLYVYDYIKPKISLYDNMNKYIISGNKTKRMVSLIFPLKDDKYLSDLLNIIEKNDIVVNFFVTENFLSNNNDLVSELISNGHNIGILMDNYKDSEFIWMDNILKKVGKQKNGYCYNILDNKENLDSCSNKKNYTIRPNITTTTTPLIDIKSKLSPGSLISISINKNLILEMQNIINYIKSKGYVISNLDNHLSEK